MDIAKELAEDMRAQIMATTGCEGTVCVVFNHKLLTSCSASIGIASNVILACLATQCAKPAGSFHSCPAIFTNLLPTLDIQDLHGFGRAAREKACEKPGTSNLGVTEDGRNGFFRP
jgi:DNA repair protein REV1